MYQPLKAALALCLMIALTACSSTTPEPTPTATSLPTSTPLPSLTATLSPTQTPTATATPEPTDTPIPSPTFTRTPVPATAPIDVLPLPAGKPVSNWNGVPVMPQAKSGAEEGGGYSYTIHVTFKQIQDFYDREMPKAGWQPFAIGTGKTDSLFLMYQKGSKTATIAAFTQGDVILVMIVQS
jgi:hypothetical protein